MGQTETVTVLFTDLVGSTELASRLGHDTYEVLRREHFASLRTAAATHGGAEVKSTGDGLMFWFSSPADAVGCAVAMQQATDVQARSRTLPLRVRIGMSIGEVSREDGDLYGASVVEASRLCTAASGGQILVAEVVRLMARGRSTKSFTPIGPLILKGLPEPLTVCSVGWEPLADATQLPLPLLLAANMPFVFAGRAADLDAVLASWKRVLGGERCGVLIAGEPGIGKTRLATEVGRRVHARGANVIYGRCDDEMGVPFQPFVEALQQFLAHHTQPPFRESLRERLGRYAGELIRLAPEIAGLVPGLAPPLHSDPETERYRLFDAVAAWLATAARERPLLLVLDDLHWAAKPTLLLLKHILDSAELAAAPSVRDPGVGQGPRLMILGAYRDTDIDRTHALSGLLADLRRTPGVERLALSGLDEAGVRAFIEAASGQALDETGRHLAHAVHAETEGNPFFIGEVIRHLAESGDVSPRDGHWIPNRSVAAMGIPEGVRDVIGRRLGRLSAAANEALAQAALIGRDFDVGVLSAVTSLDEAALLAALDEAASARLIEESGVDAYHFAHALVRATLYEEMSVSRRVRAHRRIADAIHAQRPDDVTALAYHYGRAAAGGDVGKAVDYALRAGDQARTRLAHDEAAVFYRQALEILDGTDAADAQQRCDILISLGEAQRDAGDAAFRQVLLDAADLARRLSDTDRLVRAALSNSRGLASRIGGVDAERIGVLEAALAAIGDAESSQRARLLATLSQELSYTADRPRRLALSDEALAIARRLGDGPTLIHVLFKRYGTLVAPDTLTERLANSAEHLALAEQLDDPVALFHAAVNRVLSCVEAGDIAEVDRGLAIMSRVAEDLDQPALHWQLNMRTYFRALLAGRIGEAEELVTRALQYGQMSGQPDATMIFGGQLFLVRYDQGRVEELEPVIAQTVAEDPGQPVFRAVLALTYCEVDRQDDARRLFQRDAANDFADIPYDSNWLAGICIFSEVCSQLGEKAAAEVLYRLLAPWHNQVSSNGGGILGSVARHLGQFATLLGRYDDADAHFAEAHAMHEHLGAPIWLARTQIDWARMYLARQQPGDRIRARVFLEQALNTARAHGCSTIERRAADLLTRA